MRFGPESSMSRWCCAASLLSLPLLALTAPQARADLLVSSIGSNQVLEYNGTTGAFVKAFVSAGSGGLNKPYGLVFGPNGNLFVSSASTNNVLEYNGTTGAFITDFVSPGNGGLNGPSFLVFTPAQTAVPEPSSLTLLGLGCAALAGWRWLRRNAGEGRGRAAPAPR